MSLDPDRTYEECPCCEGDDPSCVWCDGEGLVEHACGQFASGGIVPGSGSGDPVPIVLQPGDGMILNREQVRRLMGS